MLSCNSGSVLKMITWSETSTNQSGSAMNRSGSAAQSGSAMNRLGSFKKGIWRTDPTPRETLWERTGSTSSVRKPSPFQFEMYEIGDRTEQFFPSRRIRYGLQQSRSSRVSPGFITWLQFCLYSYLLRKPRTIWCEKSKFKNSETGVLGT